MPEPKDTQKHTKAQTKHTEMPHVPDSKKERKIDRDKQTDRQTDRHTQTDTHRQTD